MTGPRPYRDLRDLEKMLALLVEGRGVNNGTYYVHTGDLCWWLFYTNRERWEDIFLWEDEYGGLFGWALLSPEWQAFDVFVCPDLRGSTLAEGIYAWAAERIAKIVRQSGGRQAIRTLWISEADAVVMGWLERAGFVPDEEYQFMHYMTCSLVEPVLEPSLPEGYLLRHVEEEEEVENRAAVQHAAFASSMPMDAYCQRYLRFMRSSIYTPEMDMVIVAPDGRMSAFCIGWLDNANRVGLFEPVGVHPAYQRRGLGKAVVKEGLRRMQARGMHTAIVCSIWDNPASYSLYESTGFRTMDILRAFVKKI